MTRGLRSAAFAVGAWVLGAGCSEAPDAFVREDAAAIDRPAVVDAGQVTIDRPDAQVVDRPDAQAVDRPDAQAVDRPDVQAVDRPAVTSTERPDYRCGPSFEGAHCGPGRCCSSAEWCGNHDEPHCNELHGFDGMYDGP